MDPYLRIKIENKIEQFWEYQREKHRDSFISVLSDLSVHTRKILDSLHVLARAPNHIMIDVEETGYYRLIENPVLYGCGYVYCNEVDFDDPNFVLLEVIFIKHERESNTWYIQRYEYVHLINEKNKSYYFRNNTKNTHLLEIVERYIRQKFEEYIY